MAGWLIWRSPATSMTLMVRGAFGLAAGVWAKPPVARTTPAVKQAAALNVFLSFARIGPGSFLWLISSDRPGPPHSASASAPRREVDESLLADALSRNT